MKPFTQGLTIQFGSYRDHPVGRVKKTAVLGAQLTRTQVVNHLRDQRYRAQSSTNKP
jgi:hypothetical protein